METRLKLMEMLVNEKMRNDDHVIFLKKGRGFRNARDVFKRSIGRQTTLDEFFDVGVEVRLVHPTELVYYINPAHLREDNAIETVKKILADVDSYLRNKR